MIIISFSLNLFCVKGSYSIFKVTKISTHSADKMARQSYIILYYKWLLLLMYKPLNIILKLLLVNNALYFIKWSYALHIKS